jgi:predicted transcriptional regulator
MTDEPVATRVSESSAARIKELAEKHDVSTATIARHAIDQGLRAHKYYEEFEIAPQSECNADSEPVAESDT